MGLYYLTLHGKKFKKQEETDVGMNSMNIMDTVNILVNSVKMNIASYK